MEEFTGQEALIKPEQNESIKPIHEVLERAQQDFVENCRIDSLEDKQRLNQFNQVKGQITDELRKEGVDFQLLELWQRLVSGPNPEKTTAYDTPDKRVETLIKEKLLPILQKGQ